ncbi:hypothetical protein VTL71DRAFT_1 [Oculimacula yallundae]|uniref:Heme haloperoxidase family profile domain-containing protein n=1 Tax=Oculimacula yallundae TaxID=86028 RepID=A0ABR4CYS0_9HELO
MFQAFLVSTLVLSGVHAFPWVSQMPGVDSSLFTERSGSIQECALPGSQASCPVNNNHQGAAPYTSVYPYCGAANGVPGKQSCGILVPAKGDTAHYFTAPGPNDIRGPCPGLNAAANHNFLSHDGITTFTELVDAQQNVYGVGYDLAVLLATLGVGLDGDPITEKLSLGCDATPRTATPGLGPELGLDGHNKFEGDTSLSRNDYFLANGDNFSYNSTLYAAMSAVAQAKSNGKFDRDALALYRYGRYQQSKRDNGNFYFGPKSLLLFGAASFLYELFPSKGNAGVPDQATMNSFFGTYGSSTRYKFNNMEMIPKNWYSRSTPYTIMDVAREIGAQYEEYPVAFGGNVGKGNFVGIGQNGPSFSSNGMLNNATAANIACLLYQFATENQPSSLTSAGTVVLTDYPSSVFKFTTGKLNPVYQNGGFGCPLNFNYA